MHHVKQIKQKKMKNLFIKNHILESYNGNESTFVIPNGVTKIGDLAFCCCTNLYSIIIPSSVTAIGYSAFESCKCLERINIPESVKTIGYNAFKGCTNLASIQIPNSVAYIGDTAFYRITKVKPQYNKIGALRAFKAFYYDWTCRNDFHYEIGKSYHQNGKIKYCENGFHACTNPLHVFNYYWGNLSERHFAEVELSGEMDFDDEDSIVAASDIKILRELTLSELAEIYNSMEKE